MYTPKHFEETRPEAMRELIGAHPLATVVTMTARGLDANLIPLLFRPDGSALGTLIGHVARANPMWKDYRPEVEVLAIFQGPEAYITPAWYPTKAETGKAVPTWNYAVVHARGTMRAIEDRTWLRAQIEALTAHMETPRAELSGAVPWAPADAPADYIETMLGAIVGIEIAIGDLSGKWKVSQNQPARNQDGVIAGLMATAGDTAAEAMAKLIAERRGKGS